MVRPLVAPRIHMEAILRRPRMASETDLLLEANPILLRLLQTSPLEGLMGRYPMALKIIGSRNQLRVSTRSTHPIHGIIDCNRVSFSIPWIGRLLYPILCIFMY